MKLLTESRRRTLVVLAWVLVAAVLVPLAGDAPRRLDVSARIPGSESAAVGEILSSRFDSPFAQSAVLVVTGVPGPDDPDGAQALEEIVAGVATAPGVQQSLSYLDARDPLLRGRNGTLVLVGLDPGDAPLDALFPGLRDATRELIPHLRRRHPEARLRWTGQAVLNYDLRRTASEEVRAGERRALPVTLALVLLAFGTLVAALVPLTAGALAIALATGAAVALTGILPLSVTLQSVVSMLGLGLGIDYALLTVSRFREARAAGAAAGAAATQARRFAGHTVAVSGAAVAIGFVGLLGVPLRELRSVAVGGLLVVTASVLIATTLLPAVLGALGSRIDAGRLPLPRRARGATSVWHRWALAVARHPVAVLALAGAPVFLLAAQATRLDTRLPSGNWLPERMESVKAMSDLQSMGRGGLLQTVRVVLELPPDVFALEDEGLAALARLEDRLRGDPRVARVRTLRGAAGERGDDPGFLSLIPYAVKRTFVSQEGDALLAEAIPREGVTTDALAALVRELRDAEPEQLTGLEGARIRVGGLPGFNVDFEDAVAGRLGGIVGLVVGGTFLALMLSFRSVLIPLKAIALNLLSVAASFGALVLVFQEGHAAALVGLAEPSGSVFRSVPIYVFCIVFGLSMDYEVFLVSRVAEARREGMGEAQALARGLERTGGVITSAAAIMVAVFAAFTLGDFLMMKMLGLALAVAVLVDATLIRVAVGPALLMLAGRWNWWPGDSRTAPASRADGRPAVSEG